MLAISPDGLRAILEASAAAASTALEAQGLAWRVEPGALALCPLSDFPEKAVCPEADVVAAVVRGLVGPCCGTVVVALEPKPALRLIRDGVPRGWKPGDAHSQIEAFVAAGAAIGESVACVALHEVACGRPALVEDSLPAVLVGTHAPRDVMVVSCELHFRGEEESLMGYLCLLLDGKLLPALADS